MKFLKEVINITAWPSYYFFYQKIANVDMFPSSLRYSSSFCQNEICFHNIQVIWVQLLDDIPFIS